MSLKKEMESEKPRVILVCQSPIARYWIEKQLKREYQLAVFSRHEDAQSFVSSIYSCDALITELGNSTFGGCHVARNVYQKFPKARIFVLSDGAEDDHRLLLLKAIKPIQFLKGFFDTFSIAKLVGRAFKSQNPEKQP